MENKKLRLNNVDCCVCGSTNASLIGKGEDFEYHTSADTFFAMQCNSCNLVYLDPRPAASEFETIYPPTYHAFDFSKKEFGFVYNVRCRLEARRSLKRCRHLKNNARILDVGCGDGFHLGLLRQYGNKTWKLEGVDLDQKAVKAATRAGLDVHLGRVQDVNLPQHSYDMVFMIQTIEHLEDPPQVLETVFGLLREGGQLIIVTDNTGSIDFNWFKSGHWGGYHFPRHFNLFNRNSLSKLARDVGYDVKDLTTIVSPVNWVYSIHNYLVDHKMPQWLINRFTLKSSFSLFVFTVLDFVLQKFGRGALLQATLQKPS
jgi:2-polyprenyl-3-methyl-5-hydroxy-6-metoxy-1,4-benzoquinol methylase